MLTERIVTGDALRELSEVRQASVHAVVTDPPYGLAFMDRDWDRFTAEEYQDWCQQWAEETHRVLKPGGHFLAFSSNRTHHRLFSGVENAGFEIRDTITWHYGNGFPKHTDTLLKPATEFVVLARRPFHGSAADCFDEFGTAYLNVDGCRVVGETQPEESNERRAGTATDGRHPANAVFDEAAAARLDRQVGELEQGFHVNPSDPDDAKHAYGDNRSAGPAGGYDDSGGPSRFYYTSKATEAERTLNGQIENGHPTVKPMDLMEWLVTLVSREGQVVVDPFCGTGTTCKAAKELDRRWIGIEQQAKWADVARARCGLSPQDPSNVRDDGDQSGLEEYVVADGEGWSE